MEANTFGCYRRCTLTGPFKKIKKGMKKSTWKAELEARLIGKRLKKNCRIGQNIACLKKSL